MLTILYIASKISHQTPYNTHHTIAGYSLDQGRTAVCTQGIITTSTCIICNNFNRRNLLLLFLQRTSSCTIKLKENKQFQVSVKHNNICFYFQLLFYLNVAVNLPKHVVCTKVVTFSFAVYWRLGVYSYVCILSCNLKRVVLKCITYYKFKFVPASENCIVLHKMLIYHRLITCHFIIH